MFLPPEERWSTAALAPSASLPSILSFRVNEELEPGLLVLVAVESKFRFADRGDPPAYRRNFGCRSFSCGSLKALERHTASVNETGKKLSNESAKGNRITGETSSAAISTTWIRAQADSQSAGKNATGRENLKNEQHKSRGRGKRRPNSARGWSTEP
jgi:hypothetical protein